MACCPTSAATLMTSTLSRMLQPKKALELDPTLARPHADLAANKMEYDWDFSGGEAEFRKALNSIPATPPPISGSARTSPTSVAGTRVDR